jgi:WD40 repeat protein
MLRFFALSLLLFGSSPTNQESATTFASAFSAAWSAYESEDWPRARDSYSTALELDPKNATCAYHLACLESRAGNLDAAFQWLERTVEWGWVDADVALWDADLSALREDNRFTDAIERMRSAHRLDPQPHAEVGIVWNWLSLPSYLDQDVSPDLKHAVTTHEGEAFVWDVTAGRVRCVLLGHAGQVHWASISADGKLAVTSSEDGAVRLWNAASGVQLHALQDLGKRAIVNFDGLGQRMSAWDAFERRGVAVLDVESRRQLLVVEGPLEVVDFSFDGTRLLTLGASSKSPGQVCARLWDVDSGKTLVEIDGLGMPQGWGAFSPAGNHVLVQEFPKPDVDPTIPQALSFHVLEARTGSLLFSRPVPDLRYGPLHNVFPARFAGEDRILVCGTEEGLTLLDAGTGEIDDRVPSDVLQLAELRDAPAQRLLPTVVPAPDGTWLLIERPGRGLARLEVDGRVRDLPSVPGLAGNSVYPGFPSRIVSEDGERILLRGNGYAAVLDASDGDIVEELELPRLTTCTARPASWAKDLLISCSDGTLRSVDLDSAEIEQLRQLSDSALMQVTFAQSLERVLVSDASGVHYVLEGHDLRLVGSFTSNDMAPPPSSVRVCGSSASLSPDGRFLATWIPRGGADLWDVERRERIAEFDEFSVWSAAWTNAGVRLALCGRDVAGAGSVWLIDPAHGKLALPPLEHPTAVSCVAFSSHATLLATGAGDAHARVWDTSSGFLVRDIPHEDLFGPEDAIEQVAFNSHGDLLLTSSSSPVRWAAWELPSGRARWRVEGQGNWGGRFELDELSNRLLATGWEAQVLDLDTGQPVLDLGGRSISSLTRIPDTQRTLAKARGALEFLDDRSMNLLVSRVEYENGGELRFSASGYVAVTPGVAEWVWVRTKKGLQRLEDLAPQLLDPKRVRAAAAGIDVAPARVP